MNVILKRDNREAKFDPAKITACIDKAFIATGGYNGDINQA